MKYLLLQDSQALPFCGASGPFVATIVFLPFALRAAGFGLLLKNCH